MTLSTTVSRVSYSGNGSTTVFSFPYYFLANGDLTVILKVDSTGVETTQTITTHYTVSGAGVAAGGSVTMVTAPPTGTTLTIFRDPDVVQETDFRENDSLPAESLEESLDRLAMVGQRLTNLAARAVRLSDGVAASFDPTLPVDITLYPDSVPLLNSAGDGFEDAANWPTADDIENAEENATAAAASAAAAATSETNAAASALAAQNAVDSIFWHDVVFITSADSPFSITNSHRGKYISVDATSGAVSIVLPQISGLDLSSAFVVGIKKTDSSANTVTLSRSGTDTIDGSTTKVISVQNEGLVIIPDTDTAPDQWNTALFGTVPDASVTLAKFATQVSSAAWILNGTISASVGSSALTFAVKTLAGTDPSATDPVHIYFRNVTATTGNYVKRTITAALSTVVSSGSTLGHSDAQNEPIHVYLLDNGGTVELAYSTTNRFDEREVQTTTAEGGAGAADSRTVLYSTTARTSKPIRYFAKFISNQTVAGTYAAVPTLAALDHHGGRLEYDDELHLTQLNGYGAVNTRIKRWTNVVRNTGIGYTYADSANNGGSITFTKPGIWAMMLTDQPNSSVSTGLSVNSNQLTTAIDAITQANILAYVVTAAASRPTTIQVTKRFYPGDVVRVHGDSTPTASGANTSGEIFRMTYLGP